MNEIHSDLLGSQVSFLALEEGEVVTITGKIRVVFMLQHKDGCDTGNSLRFLIEDNETHRLTETTAEDCFVEGL